ncbi:MAG TPA: hypothetical protein PK024_11150 [Methanospirillum sp.]|uniref:hypothetical protein n=1 Tax=Methanospirillum sp. TaxID=45200 RepID=UPI002C5D3F13|nr:hypothetical protein [Methanospirillum sp.]HOJ97377.1 hypothetical protein [Methanospirillum sp.]HOL41522.1 hypothetical protein [Methanospirillum sp.]HPP77053.1 hypothetical protein [Methanospirillum sp.]
MALVPMVIIVPVLPAEPSSRPIILIFLTLLFVFGIYGMRGNRRRFLLSCILALIAVETFWVSVWPAASSLFLPAEFFLLLFLIHQAGYLFQKLVMTEGSIMDIVSGSTALLMTGGIILGTGLHLSGWISRTAVSDPALLHASFARAIPEGVLLLIGRGASSFGSSPLSMVLLMIGSVCGFLLLALTAGKIAGYYSKNRG